MGESESMRGTGEGCGRDCPEAARPLMETVEGALPELRGRPLREYVKRRPRGLGTTPVEDPVKSEGAVGYPRTWNNHLRVPTREQVRGCSHCTLDPWARVYFVRKLRSSRRAPPPTLHPPVDAAALELQAGEEEMGCQRRLCQCLS